MSHQASPRLYLAIFGALLVLTGLTVLVAYRDFGALNTPIALTIAVVKATLVVLYFMHVRWSSQLTWAFVASGFLWLALLIGFTVMDFGAREWVPVYVDTPVESQAPMAPR